MPAPKTTTPSLLPELRAFAANLDAVPYDKLLQTAAEAGWQTFVQQVDAVGQTDGTVLVTFQVFVGKDDKLEPYDLLSVKVSPGPGPVSAVARKIVFEHSLVPLFFNRLPPPPAAAPAPVQTIKTDDTDIVLPAEEEGGEYVNDPVEAATPKVVERHEPDGVPIFVDLYALGDKTEHVIAAVLDEVDDFLQRAQSVETINAMGAKNPMMIKFLKDLGDAGDIEKFMRMVNDRRTLVAPPVLSNARRRSSAAGSVN